MGQSGATPSGQSVSSSVSKGLRGRRGRVSFGPADGKILGVFNQGKSPADALDKVLV